MYAICIKSDKSILGYSLYNGFKTINNTLLKPITINDDLGFIINSFNDSKTRSLNCIFYTSAEYATSELNRIKSLLESEGHKNIPNMFIQHHSDIEKDLTFIR